MLFGLGTGRCGTESLTALLNSQPELLVTHERLPAPWVSDKKFLAKLIKYLQAYQAEIVGDVAFYHLNYVPLILDIDNRTKFICLKRNKKETVDSYDRQTSFNPKNGLGERNHWTDRNSKFWIPNKWRLDGVWDKCYPKFDLDRLDAIAEYWELYYEIANYFEKRFPENFRIFMMQELLNEEEMQREMFEFLEIKNYGKAEERLN